LQEKQVQERQLAENLALQRNPKPASIATNPVNFERTQLERENLQNKKTKRKLD